VVTESFLEPLETALNRGLEQSGDALALCNALEGRVLAVSVEGLPLDFMIRAEHRRLRLEHGRNVHADATISGRPAGMRGLLGADPQAPIRKGQVRIQGDAEIAGQFSELLRLARPDLEQELAALLGDTTARRLGELARDIAALTGSMARSMERAAADYLQRPAGQLPTRGEAEQFFSDVDDLADAVARAEARLQRLDPGNSRP